MVGLLPLCATTVIEPWQRERAPQVAKVLHERLQRMPELRESIHAREHSCNRAGPFWLWRAGHGRSGE
jgi:hypothetical protein